jgi:hypothetical protein
MELSRTTKLTRCMGGGKLNRRNKMPNHRKLREEQEGPCSWVQRLVRRWRWARRERDIIQTCGCVTYCPKCHDMLNDQACWLASNDEGLGTYKCKLCGNVSEWHFGIIPGAMLIYSAHTKDTPNSTAMPQK